MVKLCQKEKLRSVFLNNSTLFFLTMIISWIIFTYFIIKLNIKCRKRNKEIKRLNMEHQQQFQDSSEKTSDDSKCFESPAENKKKKQSLSDDYINYLLTLYEAQHIIWDSPPEKLLFHFMDDFWDEHDILKKHFFFIPHTSLREILKVKQVDKIDECIRYLSTYHVDCLVLEKNTGRFLFAIEVQGKSHEKPRQQSLDKFKRKVLDQANIYLFEISNETCSDKNKMKKKFEQLPILLEKYKKSGGVCQNCGTNLRLNKNSNNGELFLGCPNWIKNENCRKYAIKSKIFIKKKLPSPKAR